MLQRWFARRPPDPEPAISVRTLMARAGQVLAGTTPLTGVKELSPCILRLDDVDWERIEGHLREAGRHGHLRDAHPQLEGRGRLLRRACRLVSGFALLLIRGLVNRQSRCNEELLACCRGLLYRLQACEAVVVRQAQRITDLETMLAGTSRGR